MTTQPKAKWALYDQSSGSWTARVGCFHLQIETATGVCLIADYWPSSGGAGHEVWRSAVQTPCDAPDLMHLCEAELARRLRAAADTMDGAELGVRWRGAVGSALAREPVEFESVIGPPIRVSDTITDVDLGCSAPRFPEPVIDSYKELFDVLDGLPETMCIERVLGNGVQYWAASDVPGEYRVTGGFMNGAGTCVLYEPYAVCSTAELLKQEPPRGCNHRVVQKPGRHWRGK